jgi:CRP-like cAMP-binding protein
MSRSDIALLRPSLEVLEMRIRFRMEECNKPIKHVYFVEEGIASVVASSGEGKEIEVGLIGFEGMTGVVVVLGNHRSPHKTYVQMAGRAQRIGVIEFRAALEASETMRPFLLKYAHAFMVQTAHTAIATGRANVEERLARWVLMAHDRITGDDVPLTHELLALMLGVRRAGVTVAMDALEKRGFLIGSRGHIRVLDRDGLKQTAGAYYGVPESELRRLMA